MVLNGRTTAVEGKVIGNESSDSKPFAVCPVKEKNYSITSRTVSLLSASMCMIYTPEGR